MTNDTETRLKMLEVDLKRVEAEHKASLKELALKIESLWLGLTRVEKGYIEIKTKLNGIIWMLSIGCTAIIASIHFDRIFGL